MTTAPNPTAHFIRLIMERTGCSLIAAVHFAALLLVGLKADPELAALAEVNDAEHFIEGCRGPAFERKLATVLGEVHEVTR